MPNVVKFAQSVGMVLGIRSGTEEPAFDVVDRIGSGVEIRRYGARIAAQTEVAADEEAARSIGFRRLAGYIFGGNRTQTSISMTAPVAQTALTGGSAIRFFTPASWTMATLPEPDSADVTLVEVPAETVAVVRFTGDRSPAAVARKTAALRNALAVSSYHAVGEPVSWFYDPPFTLPFRRRNEVAIPVSV